MELSRPIAQSLDEAGRTMILRVDADRRYDATAMASSYGRDIKDFLRTRG